MDKKRVLEYISKVETILNKADKVALEINSEAKWEFRYTETYDGERLCFLIDESLEGLFKKTDEKLEQHLLEKKIAHLTTELNLASKDINNKVLLLSEDQLCEMAKILETLKNARSVEFKIVKLMVDLNNVPKGSVGVAVHDYADGEFVEVEFKVNEQTFVETVNIFNLTTE